MENKVLLNCLCLHNKNDEYCVMCYSDYSIDGWINTMGNLITLLEEQCFCEWKEKQICIRIADYKDEEDMQFTMRVYDHLLKCGIDVLLWEGELNGA